MHSPAVPASTLQRPEARLTRASAGCRQRAKEERLKGPKRISEAPFKPSGYTPMGGVLLPTHTATEMAPHRLQSESVQLHRPRPACG